MQSVILSVNRILIFSALTCVQLRAQHGVVLHDIRKYCIAWRSIDLICQLVLLLFAVLFDRQADTGGVRTCRPAGA